MDIIALIIGYLVLAACALLVACAFWMLVIHPAVQTLSYHSFAIAVHMRFRTEDAKGLFLKAINPKRIWRTYKSFLGHGRSEIMIRSKGVGMAQWNGVFKWQFGFDDEGID